jgi:hypothetical protein
MNLQRNPINHIYIYEEEIPLIKNISNLPNNSAQTTRTTAYKNETFNFRPLIFPDFVDFTQHCHSCATLAEMNFGNNL